MSAAVPCRRGRSPFGSAPRGPAQSNLSDEIAWYDAHAEMLADRYEAVSPERVHSWLTDLLPSQPATILDVGAGSGRDAAWLAYKGHDIVAVEPSSRFRTMARELHKDPRIQWISDSLPSLKRTFRTGLAFDVILVNAVWMHVAPSDRARAFRKLITLLKPGGVLAITLRHSPAEADRNGPGYRPEFGVIDLRLHPPALDIDRSWALST